MNMDTNLAQSSNGNLGLHALQGLLDIVVA